jgi:glycosyltransferase involved in cell wall biosynthesis
MGYARRAGRSCGDSLREPRAKLIGSLLRGSDFFVSASHYESFSLPVLEAMACGCAVVTTKNKGVTEYADDGKNCLMTETNDPHEIAEKVALLMEDGALCSSVVLGGLRTAAKYTWDSTIPQIIDYYRQISRFTPVP